MEYINPPLKLLVRDVDGVEISESEHARYSLEVPVLILELEDSSRRLELPRVSPRLSSDGLLRWLEKVIQQKI